MFKNLLSNQNIRKYVQDRIYECTHVYPLIKLENLGKEERLPIAVDIGANVGGFCVAAHDHFEKIYAFEPYVPNYQMLLQVLDAKNISNVEAYNTAIYGYSNRHLELKAPSDLTDSGGITCIKEGATDYKDLNAKCETISLGDMFDALEIDKIDYLKIDCEGSEYSIFENFNNYEKISVIAMEVHDIYGPARKEELLRFLNQHYNIIPLDNQILRGDKQEIEIQDLHTQDAALELQPELDIKKLATNAHLLFVNRRHDET